MTEPIQTAFLGNIGMSELLIVLVLVLIFFGVGKLPQVGGALGKAIRNFKNSSSGKADDGKDGTEDGKNGQKP